MTHKHFRIPLPLLILVIFSIGLPLCAQIAPLAIPESGSYADNEFQLLSRRYIQWAEDALNNGDFEASIEYSALAQENADLSEAYVRVAMARALAEKKIFHAETRLAWAEKTPVVIQRPEPAIAPTAAVESEDDNLAKDGSITVETDDAVAEADDAFDESEEDALEDDGAESGDTLAEGADIIDESEDDTFAEDGSITAETDDAVAEVDGALDESEEDALEDDGAESGDTLADEEDIAPEDDDALAEGDNEESATVSFESSDAVFAVAKEALTLAHNAFDSEDFKIAADHAQAALDALAWLSAASPPLSNDDTRPWRIGDPGLPRYYVVRPWSVTGDCFWNISAKPFVYGTPWQWRRIYNANTERTPADPNRVAPGTVLEIPASPGETRVGTYDSARK